MSHYNCISCAFILCTCYFGQPRATYWASMARIVGGFQAGWLRTMVRASTFLLDRQNCWALAVATSKHVKNEKRVLPSPRGTLILPFFSVTVMPCVQLCQRSTVNRCRADSIMVGCAGQGVANVLLGHQTLATPFRRWTWVALLISTGCPKPQKISLSSKLKKEEQERGSLNEPTAPLIKNFVTEALSLILGLYLLSSRVSGLRFFFGAKCKCL